MSNVHLTAVNRADFSKIKELPPRKRLAAKAVMKVFADHANEFNKSWPHVTTIALEAGCGPGTVSEATEICVKVELLRKRKTRSGNRYVINMKLLKELEVPRKNWKDPEFPDFDDTDIHENPKVSAKPAEEGKDGFSATPKTTGQDDPVDNSKGDGRKAAEQTAKQGPDQAFSATPKHPDQAFSAEPNTVMGNTENGFRQHRTGFSGEPMQNPHEALTDPSVTPHPPAPQKSNGASATAPASTGGGEGDPNGGLLSMSEVLGTGECESAAAGTGNHPAVRSESRPAQRQDATPEKRGGEMVTKHGYDAAQVVENWTQGLEDPAPVTGRLRMDLIKGVRAVLAQSPLAAETDLIEALNDTVAHAHSPTGYMPVAYRKALQRRVRVANPQLNETDRKRAEREHYQRVAQGGGGENPALTQARNAAWSKQTENVPTLPARRAWCDTCDPDNPGWLPPTDPADPHEKVRRCPDHRAYSFLPSRAAVGSYARAVFRDRLNGQERGQPSYESSDAGIWDAEIVD